MSRIYRLSDLGIQSALIAWGVFLVTSDPWPKQLAEILIIQLILGVYQLTASCWVLKRQRQKSHGKKIHMFLSIAYLISLPLVSMSDIGEEGLRLYLLLPSWMLAVYYYYLSWRIRFGNTKRSKFLPNLGF